MKFFVAFAALVAVAVANPLFKPTTSDAEQLEAIIAAINSPSTHPATAALLEGMLQDLLGAGNPVAGPAIVETPVFETPAVGPALIDFDHHEAPAEGSPVVVGPVPEGSAPLVQIIVNVKGASGAGVGVGAGADALAPADDVLVVDSPADNADDVLVVDSPAEIVDDVLVADLPEPPSSGVGVGDLPAPPVSEVDVADLPAPPPSGVLVADNLPILGAPAVLPDELN